MATVKSQALEQVDLVQAINDELAQKLRYIESTVNEEHQQLTDRMQAMLAQIDGERVALAERIIGDHNALNVALEDMQEEYKRWLQDADALLDVKQKEIDTKIAQEEQRWQESAQELRAEYERWKEHFGHQVQQDQQELSEHFSRNHQELHKRADALRSDIEEHKSLLAEQLEQSLIDVGHQLAQLQEQKYESIEANLEARTEALESHFSQKIIQSDALAQTLNERYEAFSQQLQEVEARMQQGYEGNYNLVNEQLSHLESVVHAQFEANLLQLQELSQSQLGELTELLSTKVTDTHQLLEERKAMIDNEVAGIEQQFLSLEEFHQELKQNLIEQEQASVDKLDAFRRVSTRPIKIWKRLSRHKWLPVSNRPLPRCRWRCWSYRVVGKSVLAIST